MKKTFSYMIITFGFAFMPSCDSGRTPTIRENIDSKIISNDSIEKLNNIAALDEEYECPRCECILCDD